jgi:hypothetical protein
MKPLSGYREKYGLCHQRSMVDVRKKIIFSSEAQAGDLSTIVVNPVWSEASYQIPALAFFIREEEGGAGQFSALTGKKLLQYKLVDIQCSGKSTRVPVSLVPAVRVFGLKIYFKPFTVTTRTHNRI